MSIENRLTNEFRTLDENDTLMRVQEYQEFYIIGDGKKDEIPGAVRYVTDDGLPCKLLTDGSFEIILDARILRRIK